MQNLTLTYDDASNVASAADGTETVAYSYDQLDRLTGATGFSGGLTAAYSYNAIGNMLTKQEGSASLTHSYPASGATSVRPHAVSSTSGTLDRSFTYDANGNMIASASSSTQVAYGFDGENRLTEVVSAPPAVRPAAGFDCVDQNNTASGRINSIDLYLVAVAFGQTAGRPNFALRDVDTDGVVAQPDQDRLAAKYNQSCSTSVYRYTYDGNGTLLKRTLQQNGTTTSTVYIGGVYEKKSDGSVTKYYGALGRTIAIRQVPAGGGAGTLYYPLTDHLGSASTVTDGAGTVVSGQKYWPYGATRSGGIAETDKLYTGQRIEPGDSALGLYNYKARFYSTTIGRFVSADPVVPELSGRGLNRYAYVGNSPVNYNDPTGHCFNYFDDQPGGGLQCNGYEDLLAWWECALSCDNWIGDLARKGIADDGSGFWGKAFYAGGTLAGDMVLSFVKGVESDQRAWGHLGDVAWNMVGIAMGVSGAFLESSLEYMIMGVSAGMMDPEIVIGGDFWWASQTAFGGPAGRSIIEAVQARLPYKDIFHDFLVSRTLEVAEELGRDTVNHRPLAWSYTQVSDILPSAGYTAPWNFDQTRYWRTALMVAARGGGLQSVWSWILPYP